MKNMFLLFSHKLTTKQEKDAINNLKIEKFITLPKELQELFSSTPSDIESLNDYLKPFKEYLKANAKKDDVALIQGDFGLTFSLVIFAKSLGLKTVYATTKRVVQEYLEGEKLIKKSIFEHERFREYE